MEIAIIVAMTPEGIIGKNNQMPWHLPADLQRFKKITMGYPIVMGRKTFESLPGGTLPGRRHIVLTRNDGYEATGCDVVTNWRQVERLTEGCAKIFVIGGAEVYEYALPMAQRMYMTVVHTQVEGGVRFPEWNKSDWGELRRVFRAKDKKNIFDMEFIECFRSAN